MNLIDLPMDAVIVKEDHAVTTSLRVAEIFGKQHKDVLRRLSNLVAELPPEYRRRNFAPRDYVDERGKTQPMIELTRDGFTLLVMGFNGREALAFKLAYIERFNAMEQQLHSPLNFAQAIPPRLTLDEYYQTRDNLAALQTELDSMFSRFKSVRIDVSPDEIEAMSDPHMQIGTRVIRVRDLVSTLEAHHVSRKVAEEITGTDNRNIRQHAHHARKENGQKAAFISQQEAKQ